MSSAILYVAIVAIWACVLIPRWLRRDSSPSSSPVGEEQASEEVTAEAKAEEEPAPAARRPRGRRDDREDDVRERRPAPAPVPAGRRDMPRDAAHRRVLASRRRLLAMLLVLAIGAGALAGTRLAAWWVVLPPSVMLLGYLILLREAGKADAERRELARGVQGAQGAQGAVQARAVRAAVSPGHAPAAPVGGPPARRAEIIDISASRGAGAGVREEPYDQDEDAKLRAVGD